VRSRTADEAEPARLYETPDAARRFTCCKTTDVLDEEAVNRLNKLG
jgi:hypothetical protein